MTNLFHNPQWLDISPEDGIPDEYELWHPERMTFNLAANDLYLPSGGNKIIVEALSHKLLCGLKNPYEEGGGENWLLVSHHNFYDIDFYFDLIHGHFSLFIELYAGYDYMSWYEARFIDNTHYRWMWEDWYTGMHTSWKTCPSKHFTDRIYTQVRYWEEILGNVDNIVVFWHTDFDPVSHAAEDSHFEAAYPVLTMSTVEDFAFVA